ncbi:GNAT family N-acetyltransferase [Alkaliphilus transvaalensis]|uniref:GNAT family N-acetyltransferase n=1 Tax=Alkaliphilus transvaalensis TaxID=114628 RepID=UPI00047B9A34|nr:GNAT family N-acetyltransferase [Alkaliphilus transvaalensis]
MTLFIERAKLEEAEVLWTIQKRAFISDMQKYNDKMNPYNETLERLKEKIQNFIYFSIYLEDEIIGGADIRKRSESHYRLNRVYIDPSYHNRGYGFNAIKLIEDYFPEATKWDLDTPHLSLANHHLYEKLGYRKIAEHKISNDLTLFDYLKEV